MWAHRSIYLLFLSGFFLQFLPFLFVQAETKLLLKDHPMVGRIWSVAKAQYIDKQQLIDEVISGRYILLGERHDNPIHHQNQAWVIEQLGKRGISASVSFEMIDNYQGDRLKRTEYKNSKELIAILNHSKTNWDYENQYKIVFDRVIQEKFLIYAANLNRQRLMHMVRQGEHHYPPDIIRLLRQSPLSMEMEKNLLEEIEVSHCNMLNEEISSQMLAGQRVRDAIMALSLLNSNSDVRVLIAGIGHTRTDRGVPFYLSKQNNLVKNTSLAFLEVSEEAESIEAYTRLWGSEGLPFDYVWFTPMVKREDACEKFKQHFKKSG